MTIAHRDGVGFPEENAYFIPSRSRKFLILRLEKRPLFEEGQCVWCVEQGACSFHWCQEDLRPVCEAGNGLM